MALVAAPAWAIRSFTVTTSVKIVRTTARPIAGAGEARGAIVRVGAAVGSIMRVAVTTGLITGVGTSTGLCLWTQCSSFEKNLILFLVTVLGTVSGLIAKATMGLTVRSGVTAGSVVMLPATTGPVQKLEVPAGHITRVASLVHCHQFKKCSLLLEDAE